MVQYRVVCDCDGANPDGVARIADSRTIDGEIVVMSPGGFELRWSTDPVNRRGDHFAPHRLRCVGRCRREVHEITARTVGEVLDRIVPIRDCLVVEQVSEQERPEWLNDLIGLVGMRQTYVIPFSMFCAIVTKIGDSR